MFCAGYPDYLIESTAQGEILIIPPTHWITGAQGARTLFQLHAWALTAGKGVVTNSASGFFLANGARCSPERRLDVTSATCGSRLLNPHEFVARLSRICNRVEVAF